MGLLTGLLHLFEEVAERAEQALYDEDAIQAELMDLYKQLEEGTLSEEDFEAQEEELVERLEEIEEHKQQRGSRAI